LNKTMTYAVITGFEMQSVLNEAFKIADALGDTHVLRHNDVYLIGKPYDLCIYWTPFLGMHLRHIARYRFPCRCRRLILYTVIEGRVADIDRVRYILRGIPIVTPSRFAMENVELMGFKVDRIIPHQVGNINVDEEYGARWRSKYPRSKKVILYNGTLIYRKGLDRLVEAVRILSRRRNDFIVVLHTHIVNLKFHYRADELQHPYIVIENEFGRLDLPKVYAKMKYADYIVMPSLVEGFGLPALEAMALGTPLITVNTPALNEFCSERNSFMVMDTHPVILNWNNYIYFRARDYDPRDLAGVMDEALDSDRDVLEDKIAHGYETANRFRETYKYFREYI